MLLLGIKPLSLTLVPLIRDRVLTIIPKSYLNIHKHFIDSSFIGFYFRSSLILQNWKKKNQYNITILCWFLLFTFTNLTSSFFLKKFLARTFRIHSKKVLTSCLNPKYAQKKSSTTKTARKRRKISGEWGITSHACCFLNKKNEGGWLSVLMWTN